MLMHVHVLGVGNVVKCADPCMSVSEYIRYFHNTLGCKVLSQMLFLMLNLALLQPLEKLN